MTGSPFGLETPEPAFGNKFVSTYPPFSCWTEGVLDDYRNLLARVPKLQPSDQPPLGLYVHIPFCVERCQYCYHQSHDDKMHEMEPYLDALEDELRAYAQQPLFSDRQLSFVYFGGGTPSLLSPTRTQQLLRALQEAFTWSGVREVTFECAPRSVTEDKLRLLRDHGVTRISLGVQQIDDYVLEKSGRVHRVEDVERAYEAVRRVGFSVVNLDLIVGLVGETRDSFFASLDHVIELAPESVTIYQLEIPPSTPLYQSLQAGELDVVPPSCDVKRGRLGEAFALLESNGYTVRGGHMAVRDPERHRFVYQDDQYHGADVLGIGASAFSHLDGINQQNRLAVTSYIDCCRRGELPLWRGYVLSDEERMVREFVLQLKIGWISRSYFAHKFGVEVCAHYADLLAWCEERDWLRVTDDAVEVTRLGLLQVDYMLTAFYLPEHQGLRLS